MFVDMFFSPLDHAAVNHLKRFFPYMHLPPVDDGIDLGLVLLNVVYLSGTSSLCQHGANSQFFGVFSSFGPMHQNFVP